MIKLLKALIFFLAIVSFQACICNPQSQIEEAIEARKKSDSILTAFKKVNASLDSANRVFDSTNKSMDQRLTNKSAYKVESFDDIKKTYPFKRWQERFGNGFEQYSPENCKKAKSIMDDLIKKLSALNGKGTEEEKIALFKTAVESYNKLNDENDGAFIETEQSEDLCELINKITVAAGLDPKKYGGGEGLATQWRDW